VIQSHDGRPKLTPLGTHQAAHFEDVDEVRLEGQCQRQRDLALTIVGQRYSLEQPLLPDESRPLDMDHSLRRGLGLAELGQRPVREICTEEYVVTAQSGAEQRRRDTSNRDLEPRQDACIVLEQAVRPPKHVANCISHHEHVVKLQREIADRPALPGRAGP